MSSMTGATVAITGGTGSFGSTMARYLLDSGVRAVHVLSRDESKQHDMRVSFADPRLRFFLGDVRDRDSVEAAFVGVDHVFHAAALKQVPSCEFFPLQAVKTNVLGSHNVIEAASTAGVASLVCLSTDKAVHPINAMGQSKALMEKTVQAFARQHHESGLPTAGGAVHVARELRGGEADGAGRGAVVGAVGGRDQPAQRRVPGPAVVPGGQHHHPADHPRRRRAPAPTGRGRPRADRARTP